MKELGILVHYAEIATKGKNRPFFIKSLARNIKQALAGLSIGTVDRLSGRIWIPLDENDQTMVQEIEDRLAYVFGIASYGQAFVVPTDLAEIQNMAWQLVQDREFATFRVNSRRVFKSNSLGSLEVNRQVGAYIIERKPTPVKLKGAELQVYAEMLPHETFVYVDKKVGLGGLPIGVTGKVVGLLSGGIDSPVAVFRMLRRGCQVPLVHFHSHPFVTRASQEKAIDLAEHLARYQGNTTLYLIPFGELQRDIVAKAPAKLRVILYRRFMLRIAEIVAEKEKGRALVTGESLAQVASQTLENMVATNQVSTLPVFRPLIGMDKQEIIREAQALGTFSISIIPDQDCCQLFMPREPETRAKMEQVQEAETAFDLVELCQRALDNLEKRIIKAPTRFEPNEKAEH